MSPLLPCVMPWSTSRRAPSLVRVREALPSRARREPCPQAAACARAPDARGNGHPHLLVTRQRPQQRSRAEDRDRACSAPNAGVRRASHAWNLNHRWASRLSCFRCRSPTARKRRSAGAPGTLRSCRRATAVHVGGVGDDASIRARRSSPHGKCASRSRRSFARPPNVGMPRARSDRVDYQGTAEGEARR